MEPKRISSQVKPAVKAAVRMKQPKAARDAGRFVVEGMRSVEELPEEWNSESVWVSASFWKQYEDRGRAIAERLRPSGFYLVPDPVFNAIAGTQSPQGILAVAERRRYSLQNLLDSGGSAPLFVVLEDLQDPGNAGTILRTADAAGAHGVICSGKTVDFYNAKVVRASMGSVFHLPFHVAEDFPGTLRLLQSRGIQVFAAHLSGAELYYQQDLTGPCAILIGNEGAGLTKETAALADRLVKIPQPGRAESLNAAVAAAILVYDAVRQRLSRR